MDTAIPDPRVDLTLQQLDSFVRIARTGSFRAAALEMGVSQPALSRGIKQAEQTLGVRLFDRDTRHVAITAVGRELLPVAQRILREFDSAFGELGEFMQGRSGTVTVAALPSLGAALLPQAIASFRRTHPGVEFTLVEAPADMLRATIEDGRADFGLTVRAAPNQRLHYRHLHDDPFVLLCRQDDELAALESAPWSVFANRPFIASQPRSSIRPITDAAFLRQGLAIGPAFEFPSVSACGAMVGAGLGIAALPALALDLVAMPGLASVPLVRPRVSRPVGIVTRIGRTLPPVSVGFLSLLAEHGVPPNPGLKRR